VGACALAAGRGVQPVPVLTRRRPRRARFARATLDAPAHPGVRGRGGGHGRAQGRGGRRLAKLRDDLIAQVTAAVPDAILNGPPAGPGRLPGNAHFSFPAARATPLLMLLDAKGIACSTGSALHRRGGPAQHVLLAMGADEARSRASLRYLAGPHLHPGRRGRAGRGHRGGCAAGPARPPADRPPRGQLQTFRNEPLTAPSLAPPESRPGRLGRTVPSADLNPGRGPRAVPRRLNPCREPGPSPRALRPCGEPWGLLRQATAWPGGNHAAARRLSRR